MSLYVSGISCTISSRQAPQGAPLPSLGGMQSTRSISYSPFVIMLKIAFRSAQIPSVEQVSTQTPT